MRRGFTLTEVIVAIAISATLFASFAVLLARVGWGWNAWMGTVDIQTEARKGMDAFIKDIRGATVTANTGSTITYTTYNPVTAATETGVQCYVSNNQLVREYPANTRKTLAYNVSSISFCWLQSGQTSCCTDRTKYGASCTTTCAASYLLQVRITAAKTERNITLSNFTLTEKVKLRNAS
jgi:prepilin-type N-terminal cleavage/methylation domain-containing protein